MLLPHEEVLYGGAAGGGKSSALLMAGLQYFDVPGYSALILRTEGAALTLPDGLIPRSHEWLAGTGAKWNQQKSTWTSPEGATLVFGYLKTPNDAFRYASSAYQFVGFEELTEFKREADYEFLFSRMRRTERLKTLGVPIRMRATTNPIGPGYKWVKERFVEGSAPGRAYLPSTLEDNPSLDTKEYERALSKLGPVVAAKLRHGDWSAMQKGELFRREDFAIVSEAPRPIGRTVRRYDLAASEVSDANPDPDWTVGVKLALSEQGDLIVLDVVRKRLGPDGVDALLVQTAREDGREVAIRLPQDPGQAGKSQVAHYTRLLAGYDVKATRETGDKFTRAGPFASQARARRVVLVRGPWNRELLDELESFPYGVHDDHVDAVAGGYLDLTEAKPKLKAPRSQVLR